VRILHGVTGAASQPYTISRAQRRLGFQADCLMVGPNPFRYPSDINFSIDSVDSHFAFLEHAISHYDVFHFYYRSLIRTGPVARVFPSGADLIALRAAGKTVIMHYRGSEVRERTKFDELSPYSYSSDLPGIFEKWPREEVQNFRDLVKATADVILCPDPEVQAYVPEATVVKRAIDLDQFLRVGPKFNQGKPLIVHAPSRPIVKGTSFIESALAELSTDGLAFDYKRIENMPHHEALKHYSEATFGIDQLRIGWFGVFSLELMALGKPTLAYIRDDLHSKIDGIFPVVQANPVTIRSVVERCLGMAHSELTDLGEQSRAYVERHHDSNKIALELVDIYERASEKSAGSKRPDLLVSFMRRQASFQSGSKKVTTRIIRGTVKKHLYLLKERGWRYVLQLGWWRLKIIFSIRTTVQENVGETPANYRPS